MYTTAERSVGSAWSEEEAEDVVMVTQGDDVTRRVEAGTQVNEDDISITSLR